jgi:hypothetical protein
MERDQIKKALEYLRKKDPNNPALQSYEKRLRSLTGASEKSAKGSVELYDYYKENFSSEGQKAKQTKNANSITDLNGNRQSKGYQKEITKRSEEDSPSLSTYEKAQSELKKKFGIEAKGDITYAEAQRLAREKREKESKKKAASTPNKSASKNLKLPKVTTKKKNKKERDGLLGLLDRYVAPISKGATDFLIPGNTERMAQNNPNNPIVKAVQKDRGLETKILNGAGVMAAALAPAGEAYKVADFGLNKLPKIANIANPYVKKAILGGAAGGLSEVGIAATNELANSEAKGMKDYALNVGLGVAGGAILDPAFHGLGKGITKGVDAGLKKWIPDLPERATTEGFNIPDPKGKQSTLPKKLEPLNLDPAFNAKRYHNPEQPLKEFLGKKPTESELLKIAKKVNYTKRDLPDFSKSKYSIGEPDKDIISTHFGVDVPKDLVESATPQYWQKRYEDFVGHVNQNYDTNKLTQEALEDLWTQFARYDEPVTLEQVVDLAYTGYKEPKNLNANEAWNQLGNRPPVSKNAKNIMGIDDSMFLKSKGQQLPEKLPEPESPLLQKTITKTLFKPESKVAPFRGPSSVNEVAQPKLDLPPLAINQTVTKPITQRSTVGNTVPTERHQHIPKLDGERQHFSTVTNSEKSTDDFVDAVKRLDKRYTKISDKEVVNFANEIIKRDIEEAYQFVKNAKRLDKRHNAVAFRLIDEFQARGQTERAVDMVELSASELTKAGQTLQSATLYNRLSVEGHLIAAQRQINRMNEKLGVTQKKIALTKETSDNIVQSVETMKRMTGLQDTGNDIQTIMGKWKKGNAPTDDELEIVRSFMNDYKKFVGDMSPKAERAKVKPFKEIRNRDKVVSFMSKQEELAMKRIKDRMKRANSLPVDMIYDLAVVGASKIAKGTVKLTDFTEQMAKEFGEEVKPFMNQIWDKAVETFNLQTDKISSRKLSEIEKITEKALKDKTISSDDMDQIRDFARKIVTMSGDTKLEAQMELQATLNLLERPTFGQQLATTHSMTLLLNPLTMIRNILGNEVSYRVDRIRNLLTIPTDIVRSKVFGTERTIVFTGKPSWEHFFQPTKDYAKGFNLGFKGGLRGVNPMGLQTAYDIRSDTFRSKYNPLRYLEKTLGASLRSFDTAGYYRAYNAKLRQQAMLKAVNEGLKGKALNEAAAQYFRDADDNMQMLAEEYGKYVTFQNDTKLANLLTKTKQGLNYGSTYIATAGLKPTKEFGLGTAIIPFAKTPANIIMRAIEYSPAGFLRSASLAKNVYKYRNINDIAELQLSLSSAIMGTTGFSLFGFVLADLGILTTAGHSDIEVASLERNAGKQPNSVNVSALKRFMASGFNRKSAGVKENDTFVSYDWLQPISVSVALGTGVHQSAKEQGSLNPFEAGLSAVNSAGKTVIEMSALSGLNDFLKSYGDKKLSEYFTQPAQGLPSAFAPTFLNQFRKLSDNTARNTYSPDYNEGVVNKIKNRVPGVERSLPIAYDTLGNKRQLYQGGTNNLLNVFFNPSFVSKYKPSAEAKFVLDYINQTGDKTMAPRFAPKQLDGIKLTGAQQSKMQRIMGEEVQKGLERIVPRLQNEKNYEKIRKALDKVLDNAGDKARKEMRKEVGK